MLLPCCLEGSFTRMTISQQDTHGEESGLESGSLSREPSVGLQWTPMLISINQKKKANVPLCKKGSGDIPGKYIKPVELHACDREIIGENTMGQSMADAISLVLHSSWGIWTARPPLFDFIIDYSSALNTIITTKLISNSRT